VSSNDRIDLMTVCSARPQPSCVAHCYSLCLQADDKIAALEEQISKDAARIQELEKFRMQYEQLVDFKQKWLASQVRSERILVHVVPNAMECT
jgi:hypothetical protein